MRVDLISEHLIHMRVDEKRTITTCPTVLIHMRTNEIIQQRIEGS